MTSFNPTVGAAIVPGLVYVNDTLLIVVEPGVHDLHVRIGVEQMLVSAGSWGGFHADSAHDVLSVPRMQSATQFYAHLAPELLNAESGFKFYSMPCETLPPNLYSPEGCALLKEAVPQLRGVTTVALGSLPKDACLATLRLRAIAAALSSCGYARVFFIPGEGKDIGASLANVFANVLVVKAQEPDPGYSFAHSIGWTAESVLGCTARKPQLEQLKLLPTGGVQRVVEDMVAKDYLSRQIFKLRGKGLTLEQIGKKLEIDKSTVSRRLEALPAIAFKKRDADLALDIE